MKQISINDKLYPQQLKNIENAPHSLYLEGNIALLKSKSIAIIGSRNCSENGKKIASKFSTELSQTGITIISGLAKGIDTIAHYYSYNKPGHTIAVLGNGFNEIFPKENLNLYQKILENNGLIISEYPPHEKPQSKYFLERNRIVSGLSLGVLVIEAAYRSGTSVTAKLAQKQNRPVFAIPHEIWDSHGIGTNKLIKNGANLVTDVDDIFNILKLSSYKKIYHNTLKSNTLNLKENTQILTDKKILLDEKCSNIYQFINTIPISANILVHKSNYSINTVMSALFILELNGYIKKISGGYICT